MNYCSVNMQTNKVHGKATMYGTITVFVKPNLKDQLLDLSFPIEKTYVRQFG